MKRRQPRAKEAKFLRLGVLAARQDFETWGFEAEDGNDTPELVSSESWQGLGGEPTKLVVLWHSAYSKTFDTASSKLSADDYKQRLRTHKENRAMLLHEKDSVASELRRVREEIKALREQLSTACKQCENGRGHS